jgi:GNAT superfamily N-acetyltransferase
VTDPLLSAFEIRAARPSDQPTIAEFNRRLALETEGKVLNSAILERGVAHALTDPDRLRYWVAADPNGDRIAGQAGITREWTDWRNGWLWWLQSVYVAEPYRGRGIFRALFDHIRSEARSLPDVIGLRLYVEDSNRPAHHTYQALGMKPGGYSVYEDLWIDRLTEP